MGQVIDLQDWRRSHPASPAGARELSPSWRAPEPYWAEPHTVPSPSGTRAVFASDWGNGSSVDSYVLELPAYRP